MNGAEFVKPFKWTFINEMDITSDIKVNLLESEKALCIFKTSKDIAIFTNKRLIIRDVHGIKGKKVEVYSFPYKSILMYSIVNGSVADINSEVELWTKAGNVIIKLKKDIDVNRFDKIISTLVLT